MQKSAILSNPSYIKLFYTLHSIGSFTSVYFFANRKKDEETTENVVILRASRPIRENSVAKEKQLKNERIYEKWERAAIILCLYWCAILCFSTEKRSIWNVLFLFQLKFYILGVHKYTECLCTGNFYFSFKKFLFSFTAF
jgi:hypothetical protein